MKTTTFFFTFVPLLAVVLLLINLLLAPHNPYKEKNSTFECGFHSFLGQNRTQFSISFFIFALLFLLFDLEILLVYPYVVSGYINDIYGLIIIMIFFVILALGFTFEIGKNALKIDSRQFISIVKKELSFVNKISNTQLSYNSNIIGMIFSIILVCYIKAVQDKDWKSLKSQYINTMCAFLRYASYLLIFLLYMYIITLILYSMGLVDLSVYYNTFEPLYMDNNPLDLFPEYKQMNNLQEITRVKQELLVIKEDLEIKLLFRTPQVHIDQIAGLERLIARPNPFKSYDQAQYELWHLNDAKRSLAQKIPEWNQNKQLLNECNSRILAVTNRMSQLGSISGNSGGASGSGGC